MTSETMDVLILVNVVPVALNSGPLDQFFIPTSVLGWLIDWKDSLILESIRRTELPSNWYIPSTPTKYNRPLIATRLSCDLDPTPSKTFMQPTLKSSMSMTFQIEFSLKIYGEPLNSIAP